MGVKRVHLDRYLTLEVHDDYSVRVSHDCDCCKDRPQPCCSTVVDYRQIISALETLGFRITVQAPRGADGT